MKKILCLMLLMLPLQACTNMAVTGAQAFYNRHSLQKNFLDQYLAMEIYQTLYLRTELFRDAHISIAVFNADVLLAGQVPLAWQKKKAEELTKKIPNIKQIYNLIKIASPCSTLTRLSDSWITGKVKAQLIASNDVDATRIKVVTENGSVYLMGILEANEADMAAEIASNVDGVQEVVKIFSYITISKSRENLKS